MNKTWLILKREYLSRVKKKTFILSTILTPLVFALLIGGVIFFTVRGIRNEKIAVVDPKGILKGNLENSKTVTYVFRNDVDTSNFTDLGYSAILLPPRTGINTENRFRIITKKS